MKNHRKNRKKSLFIIVFELFSHNLDARKIQLIIEYKAESKRNLL